MNSKRKKDVYKEKDSAL